MPDKTWNSQGWFWAFVCGAGFVVAAVVFFTGWYIWKTKIGVEGTLPMIIIVGVVILLIVLGLVAVCFSVLNLANATQPLGLPEGSVRAVIALMLLVLFAIVSIFLYNSVANGNQQTIVHVTTDQLTELRKQVPVVFTLPEGEGLFTVHVRTTNPAGDDLAKQLIVLLGTLVTAVSSFYFGANTVASAVAKRDALAPPNPSGISPTSLKRDGSPQDLTITGDNLANVKEVKIKRDNVTIPAQVKGATATQVNCQIVIKSNQDEGNWDVFVSDGTSEVKLPIQVKVECAVDAAAVVAATPPNPTGIGQASLKRDGLPQDLTITGDNLANVNKVRLVKDGDTIQAEFKSATATQVNCQIVIKSDQKDGSWDVFVSDGTNDVKLPNQINMA